MQMLKEQIERCLATEFEQKLFKAALDFLDQDDNPLKFNAFAFSLRELFRHVMERLAPDEMVKKCSWFVQDANIQEGRLTRFQRFKYAVQKGLSDEFTKTDLSIELEKTWPDVKSSIDALSKLTHVGPETFDLDGDEGQRRVKDAIEALWMIFAAIEHVSSKLEQSLHHHIDQAVVATSLRETNAQIDILSSNSIIEGTEISSWEITAINARTIEFSGEGTAYISMEWGRDDDHAQLNDEYPFIFSGYATVDQPMKPIVEAEGIQIDTSDWYE